MTQELMLLGLAINGVLVVFLILLDDRTTLVRALVVSLLALLAATSLLVLPGAL